MTNQQILTKACELAIANGWDIDGKKVRAAWLISNAGGGIWSLRYDDENGVAWDHIAGLYDHIFNHSFAKALWGYAHHERREEHLLVVDNRPQWVFHLQQMVIAPDPIKYLGENIG